jgi:LPS sulfotransferase NodH
MPHHHLVHWLISRASNLAQGAGYVYESAARMIQVGLQQGRNGPRVRRTRSKKRSRSFIKNGNSSVRSSRRDKAFMITCPARSGSTMLVHLLRSHPEICAHDEVFSPDKVKGITGTYLQKSKEDPGYIDRLSAQRFRDPIRFLYQIILDPQGKKMVGFKLKHDELVLPGYEILRDEIANNTNLRIIHLRRDNLLRRYLSHYIAMHVTHVTLAVGEQPVPELSPLRLEPAACEKDFETILDREKEFAALFARHPGFSISYEEMVARDPDKLRGLLDFLGVSERELTTPTRKLGRDDLRVMITNFDELRKYFSKSRFARFFDTA